MGWQAEYLSAVQRLSVERTARKITQETVAEGVHLSVRHFQRLESGECPVPLPVFYRWADLVGLKVTLTPREPASAPERADGQSAGAAAE